MAVHHDFGMPLHAEDEGVRRQRDRFYHAVLGEADRNQIACCRPNRLMMERVDADLLRAVNRGEVRIGGERYGVTDLVFVDGGVVLAMLDLGRVLVGNVLNQGAAEGDVEHLDASANGEERQVALKGVIDQRQLEAIAQIGYAVRRRMDGMVAVACRINIGAAAEEQTVNGTEE